MEKNPNILYLRAVRDHGFDAELKCAIRHVLTRLEEAEAEIARLKADRAVASYRRDFPHIPNTFNAVNAEPGSEEPVRQTVPDRVWWGQ